MNIDPTQYLCDYQKAWLREDAALAIGEKSRRIGWTWAHAIGAVLGRIEGRGNYYHSSADQTASVEFIDYCREFAEMANEIATVENATEVIDDSEISSLVMKFRNGTKIVAGSSNPKFFRSKGGEVGLDEFAFHRDGRELYKAAHATAMFWGHKLRIWSTHNGPGSYFNTMVQAAKQNKIRAKVHTVTILDAVRGGIVERIIMRKKKLQSPPTPDEKARQEWLDELRSTCPDEDTWNEEYLCVPSSDQSSLLTYALIQACEEQNLPLNDDLSKLKTTGTLYAGADIGRKHDLTSIWVDEIIGDVAWNRLLKRMKDVSFSVQLDVFSQLLQNSAVKRLCVDATGIGMMLAEILQQRFGKYRVEAVTFTAAVKSEIAMPFVRRFQDRNARIPADSALRESLHAVRKIVTAANNVRLDAARDDSGHADDFWAGSLCCHASDPLRIPLPPPLAEVPERWL